MTVIQVTSGLQLLLSAAKFISKKFVLEGQVLTFEEELCYEEAMELELSGAKFTYLFE